MNERPESPAALVDYVLGDLAPDDAAAVERTLAADTDARIRVAKLRAMIETLGSLGPEGPSRAVLEQAIAAFRRPAPAATTSAGWLDTVRRLVADVVFDSRAQPALAGFRGGAAGAYQLGFESDDVRIDVQVSRAPEEDRWRVRGSVHAPKAGRTPLEAALVHEETTETATLHQVDERGRFLIDTDPGTYDLVIRFEDQALVAPSLELP